MIGRRRVLCAGCAVVGLGGCLSEGAESDTPEPVSILTDAVCAACGMTVAESFGPAAQVFFDGSDPVYFDSVTELVVRVEEERTRGNDEEAIFVTDYSRAEYTIERVDGEAYISTHVGASTFADAVDLRFAVESAVLGAMGPDAIPFSDASEAETFVSEHGGDVRGWDDLDPASH